MTNSDLTLIAALLDRTGSMESSVAATQDGFDELINGQRAEPGQAFVTLAQFDKHGEAPVPEFVYANKPIAEVPKLQLVPRGMTPLLDATGRFITRIGKDLDKLPEDERPGLVICVTMTDGLENASTEWTAQRVRALIKQQQDEYSWKFIFIGANMDAQAVADDIGIPVEAAMTFDSHDYAANRRTYAAVSANLSGLRAGRLHNASFTQDQRDEAMGKRKDTTTKS
jgi:hypothetical protein